jgi:hypothetical protein
MDVQVPPIPVVMRREKNFIIEENVSNVRWPEECSGCEGPAEKHEDIHLEKKFKNLGQIKIDVKGIPYCQDCLKKARAAKRLDRAIQILALVFGIPLAIFGIANQVSSQSSGSTFIMCGFEILLCIALCYGIFWLLIKLPLRKIFKDRYKDPVSAWMIEEKKRDGRQGLSVVIRIPNRGYADKFAFLNGSPAGAAP